MCPIAIAAYGPRLFAPRRCTSKCRHQLNLRLYGFSDQCSLNVITLQRTFIAIHVPSLDSSGRIPFNPILYRFGPLVLSSA